MSLPVASPILSPISENIPKDFGAANGTEITNKGTILSDIDKALHRDKPPAIEYFFVKPFMKWSIFKYFGLGFAGNYYGHAAVRYTLPTTGESVVMNIDGTSNNQMVYFVKAEDYLFGTKHFDEGSSQGGIYNRNIISVRIEDYPPQKIIDLDFYYRKLHRSQNEKNAKFSLMFGNLWNYIAPWLPVEIAERGNCARWTSKGLVEAGLLRFPSLFPKSVWVNVFEREGLKDANNVHVVSYRRVKHACQSYGFPYDPYLSGVAPLHPVSNLLYFNLEKFANIVVEVPDDTITAEVMVQENTKKPNWWRYHRTNLFFLFAVMLIAPRFFLKKYRNKL